MKFTSMVKTCSFILVSMVLTACSKYTIVQPEVNSEFISATPGFEIHFTGDAPEPITLNGVDVTQYFVVEDSKATASGDDLVGFLREGENLLKVSDLLGPERTFFYDSAGPTLVLTQVEYAGNGYSVKGQVEDPSSDRGAMTLSYDGQNIPLDANGGFETTIAATDTYRFETKDVHNHQSEILYAARQTIVDEMLSLKLTEDATNDLVPIIQEVVEEITFFEDDPWVLFGERIAINIPGINLEVEIIELEVSITTVDVDEIDLQLGEDKIDFKQGRRCNLFNQCSDWTGFSFDLSAINPEVKGLLKVDVLNIGDFVLNALRLLGVADLLSFLGGEFNLAIPYYGIVQMAATVALDANDGDKNFSLISLDEIGGPLFNDGDLRLELPDAIYNFGFGLAGLIFDVVTSGIEGARDLIIDFIGKVIAPVIASLLLDNVFSELKIGIGAEYNNSAMYTACIVARDIVFEASNDTGSEDSVLITLGGRIATQKSEAPDNWSGILPPSENWFDEHFFPKDPDEFEDCGEQLWESPGFAPLGLGFRYSDTAMPELAGVDPELQMNISPNLVNQAIYAVYEGGLLQMSLPLTGEGLSQILVSPEEAETMIHFRPSIAPEVMFKGSNISVAYISVNNYWVAVDEKDADGNWQRAFESVISADIPVQFAADGELSLSVIAPGFDLTYRFGEASFNTVLVEQYFMNFMVAQINRGLSKIKNPTDVQIRIDDAGLMFDLEHIGLVGQPTKDHINLGLELNAL